MNIKRVGDYKSNVPFYYIHTKTNSQITDVELLDWIKSLKIPPAYADVHITTKKMSKILAFGYDSKGRKQYIYNPKFVEQRSKDKYSKILELNDVFHEILEGIQRDLHSKDPKLRSISIILYLIIYCGFRIGNRTYEKANGSYGISTIRYKHMKFGKNSTMTIDFIGKKGVRNVGQCNNNVIYKLLKKHNGNADSRVFPNISSKDVNEYLKQFHEEITSKDLRTWNANTLFIQFAKEAVSNNEKHPVKRAVEKVSQQLHNTIAVCKKNYIDPEIIQAVERKIKNDI
jgi:DNA topoisomerase-1